MSGLPSILLCGPSRAAVSGVSTHLNQIVHSSLSSSFSIFHFQVGSEGRSEAGWQKILRLVGSPLSLIANIVRHKIQIVHLNTSMDAKAYWRDLTYLLTSKLLFRKVIFQVHGGALPSQFLGENRAARSFLRWTLSVPDVIVLLAEAELEAYERFRGGRRILVIPNAVDLNEYRGIASKDFEQDVLNFGYIGRLSEDKGLAEIIRALGMLRRSGFDNFCCRIAGSGPFEEELRKAVSSESLDEYVKILGPVFGKDKVKFWQGTDLLLFPSYREGLPYTILEALASGTPIISTRVGAIPEVVEDGTQGLFVNMRDSNDLATAIKSLLSDRQRLRSMSRASIERARENYGVERLVRQFELVYQELLK